MISNTMIIRFVMAKLFIIIVSILAIKDLKKKWLKALFVLLIIITILDFGSFMMGIGYWLDPTGWGSNSVLADILIKVGGVMATIRSYIWL